MPRAFEDRTGCVAALGPANVDAGVLAECFAAPAADALPHVGMAVRPRDYFGKAFVFGLDAGQVV